jgi:hypothetical protein
MNNKEERIWKGAVQNQYLPGGTEENHENSWISTQNLSYTKYKC